MRANDGAAAKPEAAIDREPTAPEGKRNIGLMAGGIVCSSVGVGSLFVGALLLGVPLTGPPGSCGGPCPERSDDYNRHVAGTVAVFAGVVLVAVGAPMIVFGAKRRAAEARPPYPTVGIGLGPRGANLALRF